MCVCIIFLRVKRRSVICVTSKYLLFVRNCEDRMWILKRTGLN